MATRRRTAVPQVPESPVTQVVATPVSTFIQPSRAGEPAAPVAPVQPTPVAENLTQDLDNLTKSFGALSSSLTDIAISQKKEEQAVFRQEQFRLSEIRRKREEANYLRAEARRAELEDKEKAAELKRKAREAEAQAKELETTLSNVVTGATSIAKTTAAINNAAAAYPDLAPLVSGDGTDHSKQAISRLNASLTAGALYDQALENLSEDLENNPSLFDIEKFRERYETETATLLQNTQSLPDPGVGYATAESKRIKDWVRLKKEWSKLTRKKATESQSLHVGSEVVEMLEGGYIEAIEDIPFITLSQEGTIQDVRPRTDEEADNQVKETATSVAQSISNFLDQEFGTGVLPGEELNFIIGKSLVDFAKRNSQDNPEKAQFTLDVLSQITTGPNESKSSLQETSSVKTYYQLNKESIEGNIKDSLEKRAEEAQKAEEEEAERAQNEHRIEDFNNRINYANGAIVEELAKTITKGSSPEINVGELASVIENTSTLPVIVEGEEITLPAANPDGSVDLGGKPYTFNIRSLYNKAISAVVLKQSEVEKDFINLAISNPQHPGHPTYAFLGEIENERDRKDMIAVVARARTLGQNPNLRSEDAPLTDWFNNVISMQSTDASPKQIANLRTSLLAVEELKTANTNDVIVQKILGKNNSLFQALHSMYYGDDPLGQLASQIPDIQQRMAQGALSTESVVQSFRATASDVQSEINSLSSSFEAFIDPERAKRLVYDRVQSLMVVRPTADIETAVNKTLSKLKESAVNVGSGKLTFKEDVDPRTISGEDPEMQIPQTRIVLSRIGSAFRNSKPYKGPKGGFGAGSDPNVLKRISEENTLKMGLYGNAPKKNANELGFRTSMTLSQMLTRANKFVQTRSGYYADAGFTYMYQSEPIQKRLDMWYKQQPRNVAAADSLYNKIIRAVKLESANGDFFFAPKPGSKGKAYYLFVKDTLGSGYTPQLRSPFDASDSSALEFSKREMMILATPYPGEAEKAILFPRPFTGREIAPVDSPARLAEPMAPRPVKTNEPDSEDN